MRMYDKLSDIELTALLKEGDHAAFTEIYSRYWTVLYLHGRKMLHDDEEARDVVQELFTYLWKNGALLVVTESLSSYLYRSVRNRIFNLIERKRIMNDYQKSLIQFLEVGELVTDELIREKELSELIEKEIQLLPPKMREVFELSRKQHLSYKQIGDQLGISDHTVRRQVSNALSILRAKLGVSAGIVYILLVRG